MFGGRHIYSKVKFGDAQVRLPREAHLIAGDIIVSKALTKSDDAVYMYSKEGLINLDKRIFVKEPDAFIQKLMGNKCFVVLRPSTAKSFM